MIEVSIIIVSYNVRHYLNRALYSLLNSLKDIEHEIILIDNHSDDDTVEMVKNQFGRQVKIIENKENLGFGKANNQGMRIAQGKYLLLLNPDTIVQEDTIQLMVDFMERKRDAGAAGCKVLNPDGTLQLACRRSFPSPWASFFKISGLSLLFPKSKMFSSYNLTFRDENETHEVDAISGSFMFIRRSVLEEAGYFDEAYFMYGEDLDLCYQINKIAKIYYYPEAKIIHYKGESSKSRFWKTKLEFYRSMALFVKKNYHSSLLLYLKPLIYIAILLNALLVFIYSWTRKKYVQILDFLSIQASFLLTVYLRYGELGPLPPFMDERSYVLILIYHSFIYFFIFKLFNVYQAKNQFIISKVAGNGIVAGLFLALFTFFLRFIAFSRIVLLSNAVITVAFMILWRLASACFFDRKIGYLSVRKVFLAGLEGDVQSFLKARKHDSLLEFQIMGVLSLYKDKIGKKLSSVPIIGDVGQCAELAARYFISEIIIIGKKMDFDQLIELFSQAKRVGVRVKMVTDSSGVLWERRNGCEDNLGLIGMGNDDVVWKLNFIIKRIFDFFMGMILIIYLLVKSLFCFPFKLIKLDKISFFSYYKNKRGEKRNGGTAGVFHKINSGKKILNMMIGRVSLIGIHESDKGNYKYLNLPLGLLSIIDVIKGGKLNDHDKKVLYSYYQNNLNLFFDLEIIIRLLFQRRR